MARMSLPSRERGLKSTVSHLSTLKQTSLPSRERGLKYFMRGHGWVMEVVAPFAGAWIEIRMRLWDI